MTRPSEPSASQLRTAAGLLLSLPALTATACYAHGHGSLGGAALGLAVAFAIAAGAWGASLLLQGSRSTDSSRARDLILNAPR